MDISLNNSQEYSLEKTEELIKILRQATPEEVDILEASYKKIVDLIDEGADPNSALILSAVKLLDSCYPPYNKYLKYKKDFLFKIYEVSLKKGANLNTVIPENPYYDIYPFFFYFGTNLPIAGLKVQDLIIDLEIAKIALKHTSQFNSDSSAIYRNLEENKPEVIRFLLDHGVKINEEDVKYSVLNRVWGIKIFYFRQLKAPHIL